MFYFEKEYSNNVQNLINEIEKKQIGLQVIKVKQWALPVKEYSLELEISKSKNLNMIEEFIIKIALSDIGCEVTEEVVQSMLGLDEVFTSKYINRLAEAGVINKECLPILKVTELGEEQFKKGHALAIEKKQTVKIFIQPNFKLFYSKLDKNDTDKIYPFLELKNDDAIEVKDIKNNSIFMNEIVNIAKENKIILNKESINQFVSNVNSVTPIGDTLAVNYIELWIYDVIEEKLYCRVWDCHNNRYNNELSEYIMKNKPLTKSDFEINKYESEIVDGISNKHEELFKKEVKEQRDKDESSKLTSRMLRGYEIKEEFDNCLRAAKTYLYIQSPWISDHVVDDNMMQMFKNLVAKGCKIFISWGIAKDINKENRLPNQELIDKLRNLKLPNGMSGVFVYWIGNHHNKEIIVDEKAHLVGSFNWLSYRGDYLPRGESVYIINDKNSINEAKVYWEGQIFKKISEDLWKEDYIRDFDALINLKTKTVEARDIVLKEIDKLISLNKNDSYIKLYNIALIYFKNQLFDDVFVEIILKLLDNDYNVREIFIMINYLKNNNNIEIYEKVMGKYKEKFIAHKIIDNRFKSTISLNNKNVIKELKFM